MRRAGPALGTALGTVLLLATAGCGLTAEAAAPRCDSTERVALVAQSVPTASYVPCLEPLPEGWSIASVRASTGRTVLRLASDRAEGGPVEVALTARCDTRGAVPAPPRAEGVRSAVRLTSVAPDYAGVLVDSFPGGCVTSRFSFPRGPHIGLMEELAAAVRLLPRLELRGEVRRELGVELDP